MSQTVGRVHSYQTLGTLDGPGVRFVVFLQGCPLRCGYCHNPDTWDPLGGIPTTPEEVLARCLRYRNYFGEEGGITLSGGEPLLQAGFVKEIFTLCKENGIHTTLDTSGCRLDGAVEAALSVTDLVLLDVKMTTEEDYHRYIGGSLAETLAFLEALEGRGIPTWIRQVITQGVNDSSLDMERLGGLLRGKSCVKKVELLPFRKLCLEKYRALGVPFPFEAHPETGEETIGRLMGVLGEIL